MRRTSLGIYSVPRLVLTGKVAGRIVVANQNCFSDTKLLHTGTWSSLTGLRLPETIFPYQSLCFFC